MKLLVNGEEKQIAQARDVAGLVAELGLPAPTVLIEHNGLALRRDEWTKTLLAEGDRIEILRIAAGG
jgi:thiamine biosynthesis protein ThiS